MSDVMQLFNERLQNRTDLLAGKVPKRVLVMPNFAFEAACGLAGVDLMRAHYDPELAEKAFAAVSDTFYSDTLPGGDLRYPAVYQLLGAKNWILGSNGAVQHPEIEVMKTEDYDAFIKDPYTTIMEVFLPRVCTALDGDKTLAGLNLAKAYGEFKRIGGERMGIMIKLMQKHGFAPGFINAQMVEAPFDFLSDQLRGFTGATIDSRRMPDKVEAAVDAITPLMVKLGTPVGKAAPGRMGLVPLHLAPYINDKQFERLWWPSFEKMVTELDAVGHGCYVFAEQDWTARAHYFERLPASSIICFELGDIKVIKETAGKNHVIGGLFDPTITLTKSREDCIDAAKRLLDAGMPGGRFFFGFDKGLMDIKSINVSKLQAVLEWVRDNAVY